MPFAGTYGEYAQRLRVPMGIAVGIAYLVFAAPTWVSFAWGGSVAALGLAIRAWAAGHLAKNETLTRSGPFAFVRNPLYVGTLTAGIGLAFAGNVWWVGLALVGFFLAIYLPVVRKEEEHLATLFADYGAYQQLVPAFVPRLSPAFQVAERFRGELYLRNQEYKAGMGFLLAIGVLAGKATGLVP